MKKKLQLGLLIDDYQVPAWVFKMLEKIISSKHSEITLIVKKKIVAKKKIKLAEYGTTERHYFSFCLAK